MVYLIAAGYDEERGVYRGMLRLNNCLIHLLYDMGACPHMRLTLEPDDAEPGEILCSDIEEYMMRRCGGTWEYWRMNTPVGKLECHVIWYSAREEQSPLASILGCSEPIVLSDGVLFVVRVQSAEPSSAEPAPLPSAEPLSELRIVRASERVARRAGNRAQEASDGDIFLPHYSDDILRKAGVTRAFVRRVWEIVQRKEKVSSHEIAHELALPRRSRKISVALSILVQERLIYQAGQCRFSRKPTRYRPADESFMTRVLNAVRALPGAETKELARALGVKSATVSDTIRYLAAQGLIRRELTSEVRGTIPRAVWRHYPAD